MKTPRRKEKKDESFDQPHIARLCAVLFLHFSVFNILADFFHQLIIKIDIVNYGQLNCQHFTCTGKMA